MSLSQLTGSAVFDKAGAYRNAAFTLTASATVLVPIDTTSFDTNLIVDLTNSRITPKKAGYYQVSSAVNVSATASGQLVEFYISKNAVNALTGDVQSSMAASFGATIAGVVYLNGTTDYIDLRVYCTAALALNVGQGAHSNYIHVIGPF